MHTYIFTHTYLYTLMHTDFFEISHGIRHVILILKKYYAENIMRTAFAKSQSSITQGGRPEANPQYANDVLKVKLTSRMIRFKDPVGKKSGL